jgi:hypothetical protein
VWDGSLGPDDFKEPVYQFSVESKTDFTCHIYDFVVWFNYLRHVRFSRMTYVPLFGTCSHMLFHVLVVRFPMIGHIKQHSNV